MIEPNTKRKSGDTSPDKPGLVFIQYKLGKEYWGTPEQLQKNQARAKEWQRQDRKRNPERHKAIFNKWLAKPGSLETKRKCYHNWVARPEGRKVRREVTGRYLKTINGALINRLRPRIWHALKKGCTKSASTLELVGCSISEFKQYLEKQFEAGMTWKNMGAWEIDHRVPLAAFNLADPEQQKLAFNFHNCRPMWKEANRAKSDFIEHNGERVRARNIIPFSQAA